MMQALYAYERLVLAGQLETVTKASDLRTRTLGDPAATPHPPTKYCPEMSCTLRGTLLVSVLHVKGVNYLQLSSRGCSLRTTMSEPITTRQSTELAYEPPLDLSISDLETEQHQAFHAMPSKLPVTSSSSWRPRRQLPMRMPPVRSQCKDNSSSPGCTLRPFHPHGRKSNSG